MTVTRKRKQPASAPGERTEKAADRRTPSAHAHAAAALIALRVYQSPVFWSTHGLLILHWSRQIGKSYTLAAWAVYRLLTNPGRLVTVLSNSRDNGSEFIRKVAEILDVMREVCETEDMSPDHFIESMRIECRVKVKGKVGRVRVLAANPRTARGFSGDLILDEFAFHENSVAIWDAAEPILLSNPDYLCRVASTGNGRYNMFYRLAAPSGKREADGVFLLGETGFPVSRVTLTDAWKLGFKIYNLGKPRREITPEAMRVASLDKRSHDQNYECSFNDENMALLSQDLISAAEYSVTDGGLLECRIEEGDWTYDTLDFLRHCKGPLCMGIDVGRSHDITSFFIGEKVGGVALSRALLRLEGMRLPQQLERMKAILSMPNFGRCAIDATGIGLGLGEFAQEQKGGHRVELYNFSSREKRKVKGIEQSDNALIGEILALDGLRYFEDHRVRIPMEVRLRDALRKPERVQTAGGVRIAVERDEAGHADEFWALMLMLRAMQTGGSGAFQSTEGIQLGSRHPAGRQVYAPRSLAAARFQSHFDSQGVLSK